MNIEEAKKLANELNWSHFDMSEDSSKEYIEAIETVLSELEKKEAIINKMSNFINLMSDELVAETGDNNLQFCKMKKCIDNGELDCEECIKNYFSL